MKMQKPKSFKAQYHLHSLKESERHRYKFKKTHMKFYAKN